jgi:protein TonB
MDKESRPLFLAAIEGSSGDRGHGAQAGIASVFIHCGAIALLCLLAGAGPAPFNTKQRPWHAVLLRAPIFSPSPDRNGGGGGGGRSPLPANAGAAPRFDQRQFVPPSPPVSQQTPVLLVQPTLVGPSDQRVPRMDATIWGDPKALPGPPSPGPGCCSGIGSGRDGGMGPDDGPGFGPGHRRSGYANVFTPGRGGVSRPIPIYQVEPDYSDEARKAHFQGTVVLEIVIDEHGLPTNFKILTPLGLGLDQKAVDAVKQWRFRPGMKDGKPVAVVARVEVTFRLL